MFCCKCFQKINEVLTHYDRKPLKLLFAGCDVNMVINNNIFAVICSFNKLLYNTHTTCIRNGVLLSYHGILDDTLPYCRRLVVYNMHILESSVLTSGINQSNVNTTVKNSKSNWLFAFTNCTTALQIECHHFVFVTCNPCFVSSFCIKFHCKFWVLKMNEKERNYCTSCKIFLLF